MMSEVAGWWRAAKRVVKSGLPSSPASVRRSKAYQAYESGLWDESAALWEEIFEDTADPKERRFAGRRAALSYRKAANFGDARRLLRGLIAEFPEDRDTRRELARFELEQRLARAQDKYWHRRKRLLYIQVSKKIAQRISFQRERGPGCRLARHPHLVLVSRGACPRIGRHPESISRQGRRIR